MGAVLTNCGARCLTPLAFLALACAPERPRGPNVLLITIDTLRADHLGCYGFERGTSPEIDALAAQACVFEDATSSSSWTLPSLASIHTSLYSTTHGCWKIQSRLEPELTTLAEVLRDAGWDTAMVACHVFLSAQYGLQQGFTHVDDELVRPASDANLAISSPGVTERGVRFLERKAASPDDVPFFLWLHYFDPHDAYVEHDGFTERFGKEREIDRYDGEIAFTDHHVGRVLRRVKELGLDDDTIVVITADHGEEFGEHGFDRHGYSLYQAAVRIPLVVRVPGAAPRRVSEPVSNVDLMPTLLAACGLELERVEGALCEHGIEGRSLLGAIRAGDALAPREAVSEVRWHEGQDLRALRSGSWKLVEDASVGQSVSQAALFDLAMDPGESASRLEADVPRAASLRHLALNRLGRALEWSKCYPLRDPYSPSPGDQERLRNLGYTGKDDAAPPPEEEKDR